MQFFNVPENVYDKDMSQVNGEVPPDNSGNS